jgi:hypothetical protein
MDGGGEGAGSREFCRRCWPAAAKVPVLVDVGRRRILGVAANIISYLLSGRGLKPVKLFQEANACISKR